MNNWGDEREPRPCIHDGEPEPGPCLHDIEPEPEPEPPESGWLDALEPPKCTHPGRPFLIMRWRDRLGHRWLCGKCGTTFIVTAIEEPKPNDKKWFWVEAGV